VREKHWLKLAIPLLWGVFFKHHPHHPRQGPGQANIPRTSPIELVDPLRRPHGDDITNDCQESIHPCQTIPRALQVAGPGDYIHGAGGNYTGSMYGPDIALGTTATFIITKPISSLMGGYSSDYSQRDDAATETILSASSSPGAYAAVLAGTDVRFGGFTITGATWAFASGGFVYPGGGLRVFGGSPTIEDNLVIGNQAYHRGGGRYIGQDATPAIVNNTITSNSVATVDGDNYNEGGGIYLASGIVLVRGNQILSNTAEYRDAGIFVGWNVAASIISNTITYNTLQEFSFSKGAGIHTLGDTTTVHSQDNQIHHNSLTGGFEGSGVVSSPAIIDANWIAENYAPGGRSAVCVMEVTHHITLTNNIITNNTSIGVRLI
jgi:hypothetical protein